AGGGGEAADVGALLDDGAGAEEPDAHHHLRRHARDVDLVVGVGPDTHVPVEAVDGDDAEQGGADGHRDVRTQAGRLVGDLALEPHDTTQHDGQHQAQHEVAGADGRMGDGSHHRYALTFFNGAHASSRRFSPTLAKRTTASALSSLPNSSSTTPSPHLPWTTSSPTVSPSRSPPLVRAGVIRPARSAASTMPARPRSRMRLLPPSTRAVRCSGISLRKRLGGLYWVEPNSIRLHACERCKRSRARVIPT